MENYALKILKESLNNELRYLASAKEITSGNGFKFDNITMNAFNESKRVAEERIPDLIKAINTLEYGQPSFKELEEQVSDLTEKGHNEFCCNLDLQTQIKELQARLETGEKILKSSKDELEWMWDNMGKPHTSDHFNRPANVINEINAFIINKTD